MLGLPPKRIFDPAMPRNPKQQKKQQLTIDKLSTAYTLKQSIRGEDYD
jgi:hypothetical protein